MSAQGGFFQVVRLRKFKKLATKCKIARHFHPRYCSLLLDCLELDIPRLRTYFRHYWDTISPSTSLSHFTSSSMSSEGIASEVTAKSCKRSHSEANQSAFEEEPPSERRLKPWLGKMPSGLHERLSRALYHRLYVIARRNLDDSCERDYEIMGHSGVCIFFISDRRA